MRMIQTLGIFALSFFAFAPVSMSYGATMKECAAQWDKMKAAKQTEGKTYKEFSKECMSGSNASAPASAPAPAAAKPDEKKSAAKATDTKTTDKPASGGRAAEVARERACAQDWKADKAAKKVSADMKWPQYWSECDKRKKAAGM